MNKRKYRINILIDDRKMTTEAAKIEVKIDGKTLFKFNGLERDEGFQFENMDFEKDFQAFTMQSLSQAMNSAFGHPHRFRIIMSLKSSSKSFTELKKLLSVSSPTVDYHLSRLVKDWIVSKDEEERYVLTILGEFILGSFSEFLREAEKLQQVIANS